MEIKRQVKPCPCIWVKHFTRTKNILSDSPWLQALSERVFEPSLKVCYSHREPQRVRTRACQGWPILCRSSWQHCPPASDPNTSPHLGRRSGSATGSGFLQTPASQLCGMGTRQQGKNRGRVGKKEKVVIKIKYIKHTNACPECSCSQRWKMLLYTGTKARTSPSFPSKHYYFIWWRKSKQHWFSWQYRIPMMFTECVSCQ